MRFSSSVVPLLSVLLSLTPRAGAAQATPRFRSSRDTIPAGWTGPVFALSQDYPTAPPPAEPRAPWRAFDPKTQWRQYIMAVRAYCYEGNLAANWVVQRNTVRKWYHAPWLDAGPNGREFIHGMTRERVSRPRELAPTQTSSFANWAVGFYNPAGGYAIGQVWKDAAHPNAAAARFRDGAVACKLLFTTATTAQVPYLAGSPSWQGNINVQPTSTNPNPPRSPQTMRLLQMDIAVRDARVTPSGWVFGTFIYNAQAPGRTPWEKMQPVGLQWGNDPTVTDTSLKESVINPDRSLPPQHLGWNRRLDGPVDNPQSACMSCHATAQWPVKSPMMPPSGTTPGSAAWMRWYRDLPNGTPFDTGAVTLDFSLQLASGIENLTNYGTVTGGARSTGAAARPKRVTRDP